MHCSANIGAEGDVALFFGLSGTGKTTLSADPSRTLIGDDEHGWSDRRRLQFRGWLLRQGDQASRPRPSREIYATTARSARCSRTSSSIPRPREPRPRRRPAHREYARLPIRSTSSLTPRRAGIAATRATIVMLTADAFGVLPPIARLTPEQAMYHFLSGYTAKVAGTERGVTEPQATFSTCFGAPFMPRHPTRLRQHAGREDGPPAWRHVWLVNTGWTGGGYGVGARMSIGHTRAHGRAALDGTLARWRRDRSALRHAGAERLPGRAGQGAEPQDSWTDKNAYDTAARDVAQRFEKNFQQFEGHVDSTVNKAAIRAAACKLSCPPPLRGRCRGNPRRRGSRAAAWHDSPPPPSA